MEKAVTYYNFAENDYLFLKANVEENRISNAMCSSAQNQGKSQKAPFEQMEAHVSKLSHKLGR